MPIKAPKPRKKRAPIGASTKKAKKEEKRGRPTKYSKEIQDELCKYIKTGATYKDACMKCGISEDSFGRWRKQYSEFSGAIEGVEMDCKLRMIALIHRGAAEDWRAAMAWLECRYNDEYGKNKYELTHKFSTGAENTRKLLDVLLKGTQDSGAKHQGGTRPIPKKRKGN